MRLTILIVLVCSTLAQADWWDGLTDKVSSGLVSAAGWVKDTASPAIRDKFNEYKETLQDPETHKTIREWLTEKAEAASEFAKTEVVPELKKIYEAATKEDENEKNDEIRIEESTTFKWNDDQ